MMRSERLMKSMSKMPHARQKNFDLQIFLSMLELTINRERAIGNLAFDFDKVSAPEETMKALEERARRVDPVSDGHRDPLF